MSSSREKKKESESVSAKTLSIYSAMSNLLQPHNINNNICISIH